MLTILLFLTLLPGCRGRQAADAIAVVNGRPVPESAFVQALPRSIAPDRDSLVRQRTLDALIDQELFVQEAERQGLDSAVAFQLETEQKGLVMRELFRAIARETRPVTEMDCENAYRLMQTEDSCQVIVVPAESLALANRLVGLLEAGAPFETLAARFSVHRSGLNGGQVGWIPHYRMADVMLQALLPLTPGRCTRPVLAYEAYQIVKLLARRPVRDLAPYAEMKQQLKAQLELERERDAANRYVAELRRRLVYDPAGLAVFHKPADSIAPEELSLRVAVKDNKQYVKVERLMHVARRFPPLFDTSYRTLAIRRAIEEDVMYEDGLERGLEKLPSVKTALYASRRKYLYEALYRREIGDRVFATDDEARDTFVAHQERYAGNSFEAVAGLIRNEIMQQRRAARRDEYVAELRQTARITTNHRRLYQAGKTSKEQ